MSEAVMAVPNAPKRIGIAADHGGFELKQQLLGLLAKAGYEVIDFGAFEAKADDDYPDYVVPLARACPRQSGSRRGRMRQRRGRVHCRQ